METDGFLRCLATVGDVLWLVVYVCSFVTRQDHGKGYSCLMALSA